MTTYPKNRSTTGLTKTAKPSESGFHSLSSVDALTALAVDATVGLSEADVAARRLQYGPNEIAPHPVRGVASILIAQFRSLIVALLVAAAIIAFAFGEEVEGYAVVVVIVLNAAIGFFSELRAVRSMEALFEIGTVTTRVRREGKAAKVPARELVPGDIVLIDEGDVVTADLRLVASSKLQADESTLTGESLPVGKHTDPVVPGTPLAERASMLHKGTSVTRGNGEGVVIGTGLNTELGTITGLVQEARDEHTPLEKRLDRLGHRLIWTTLVITVLVVVIGMARGRGLVIIQTAIALAVAAIPEGLPVVATISLARGLRRMARRNALVNRLSSVETLGATGVIVTDKTGTLTENRMTATRLLVNGSLLVLSDSHNELSASDDDVGSPTMDVARRSLEVGALCNNASIQEGRRFGDPMEVALLEAAHRMGLDRPSLTAERPEVREEAFDPEVKMMATFHEVPDGFIVSVKGAPESVLAVCDRVVTKSGTLPLDSAGRDAWMQQVAALARTGLRTLALATRTTADAGDYPFRGLDLVGVVGFEDPPRLEIRDAISQCRRAGINVVMATGDASDTARNIGGQIGLVSADERDAVVIHGSEMKPVEEMSRTDKERIVNARLLVRVSPRQKLDLIGLHQQAGNVVAMTGDGVNDAPALKKADIGIAMGQRGTQVAQEAADMVLKDDRFLTIVAAVEEGREIFENIRKFVRYLLSCNISEVMVVGIAILFGAALPVLPLQILLLNLVTDVFPALALGLGAGIGGVMNRPPRDPAEPILTRQHWLGIVGFGFVFTIAVLGSLLVAELLLGYSQSQAVTVSFLVLAFGQLFHVFNMRDPASPTIRNEVTRNPYIWGALALCLSIVLVVTYVPPLARVLSITPPDLSGWILVAAASLTPFAVGQIALLVRSRYPSDRTGSERGNLPL